jgi:hypothetical protein
MEWLQLETTVASLTFEQLARLAETWVDGRPRQQARRRVIGVLEFTHGRIASRWVRWADTFGLPHPPLTTEPADILDHPYRLVDDDEVGIYVAGLLPLYDAALAILAGDHAMVADYELLSASWRRVCLPSRFTPATLYGPHTQTALESLSAACQFPRSCLTRMVRARRAISTEDWDSAADTVHQAALKLGFPFEVSVCTGRPWPALRPRWISPLPTLNSPMPSGDMPSSTRSPANSPRSPQLCWPLRTESAGARSLQPDPDRPAAATRLQP